MTFSHPLIPAKAGTQAFFSLEKHEKHEKWEFDLSAGIGLVRVFRVFRGSLSEGGAEIPRRQAKTLGPRFRGDERFIGRARL
jgi:hypothetical protein